MNKNLNITDEGVMRKIYLIRGKKVMLVPMAIGRDLASMYGVATKRLNEQVKRNEKRFPSDFMFQLTARELENWKSQNATSNKEKLGLRKMPNVFTEQGVAMLSSVLNSETAIEVNIQIIRIFTRMREFMMSQNDLLLKINELEKTLSVQSQKSKKHEADIEIIFKVLKQFITSPVKERKAIGFNSK